jgi:hypothetical protein
VQAHQQRRQDYDGHGQHQRTGEAAGLEQAEGAEEDREGRGGGEELGRPLPKGVVGGLAHEGLRAREQLVALYCNRLVKFRVRDSGAHDARAPRTAATGCGVAGCDGDHTSDRNGRRAPVSALESHELFGQKCPNVCKLPLSRAGRSQPGPDRRSEPDRRSNVVRALWLGNVRPRRHGPRRAGENRLGAVDWHHPWWLAVAVLIMALSCTDAALTLLLINRGAREVNPFLVSLVHGSVATFVLVKVALTGGGIVCLTLLARLRAFGWLPVKLILYGVLLAYIVLILYELALLGML